MKRDHFRSVGLAVLGALLGAGLAVLMIDRSPWFCDRGVHLPGHEDCSRKRGKGLEPPGTGDEPTTTDPGWATTRLGPPVEGDDTAAEAATPQDPEGAEGQGPDGEGRVLVLPDPGWAMLLVPSPADFPGRTSDITVSAGGRAAWVHSDGRRSVVVLMEGQTARVLPGSEGGHSPFFQGETAWWLRGGDLLHEGPDGAVLALTGPGEVRDPAVRDQGFSVVVGDTAIEVYDLNANGVGRLDLPERLGGMAWRGETLIFTRMSVGDADIWRQEQGSLSPLADTPLTELRPSVHEERVLWFQETEPGSFDLVRDGRVVLERVALPTRQGPAVGPGGQVVAGSETPGSLLLLADEGGVERATELITGLDWVADPVWLGTAVLFAGPGGLARLSPSDG